MSLPKAMTLTERLRYRSLWKNLRAEFAGELNRLEENLAASCRGAHAPLPEAAAQLVEAGGKRVRPLLAWLSCTAVGADAKVADSVAIAAELTHAATLLHDDVLDEGEVRRGKPASRILHGNRISILAGDFLLTRALGGVFDTGNPEIFRCYQHMLQNMVDGEVLQQEHRFDLATNEEVYEKIVALKTAALFEWSARAGAMAAGADEATSEALAKFGHGSGVAFQVLDDWLDWVGEGTLVGKAVLSDLKEGKPSLAVIYGCQMSEDVSRWFESHLRDDQPPPSDKEVGRLAGMLTECGALAKVRGRLETATHGAIQELEVLPASPARDRLVRFARLLLARDS